MAIPPRQGALRIENARIRGERSIAQPCGVGVVEERRQAVVSISSESDRLREASSIA
jgi:hypothetical protein